MSTSDTPLVSAIVRSMGRPWLGEALASLAAQTHPRLEVVVVDALGSGHPPVLTLAGAVPVRTVAAGRPLPRAAAANAGLDAVRGDLVFFLDDDDLVEPDHVASLVRAWSAARPARGAYGGTRVEHYRDGRLFSTDTLSEPFDRPRLWGRNFLPIHSVLFERSLLAEGCRFDESLEVYEDWDFWVQITQRTDLVHVPACTARYRNHGHSGFGLETDPAFIARHKAAFFEKWRHLWSGEQLNAIIERREDLLQQQADAANRRQGELQSDAARLRAEADEAARREAERRFEAERLAAELAAARRDAEARAAEHAEQVGILMAGIEEGRRIAEAAHRQAAQLGDELRQATAAAQRERDDHVRVLQARDAALQQTRHELESVYASRSWRMTAPYRGAGTLLRRARVALFQGRAYARAQGGGARGYLRAAALTLRVLREQGISGLTDAARRQAARSVAPTPGRPFPVNLDEPFPDEPLPVPVRRPPPAHGAEVDVIVCVHNALDDVRRCLESVRRHGSGPYRLILVDDGSGEETRDFLVHHAAEQGAVRLRNDTARGYTMAANQGLRESRAPYVVLLNSDTIVGPQWLDRLVACAESDASIGLVGPLSNTASWQSIPAYEHQGDWATNPLPEGIDVDEMARLVAAFSVRSYPRLPFLNGFCLMIRRELIDRIGLFDEEGFARGYGEENDFCLRTGKAGFALAVADDTYVFHAQSKSYSTERRRLLSEQAGQTLARKHGQPLIDAGTQVCRHDRVMRGLRAHASALFVRHGLIGAGRARFAGRRVAFVLPVAEAGGGANVVLTEAAALRRMGVEVVIVNFERSRAAFESSYDRLDLDLRWAADPAEIPSLCTDCDAVIATMNTSVSWIAPLGERPGSGPVLGYYVQDYEPRFYDEGSAGWLQARASYTAVPQMVCVTKSPWNAEAVRVGTGRHCTVIGPSYDLDLFRPRRRARPGWPDGPVRIAAMIRPSSPRRGPRMTMEVLRAVQQEFGARVAIELFGVDSADLGFQALPHDFVWTNLGPCSPTRVAQLLNRSDIFVDFSTYQAMGLTAMEAMGCGVAVVLPAEGGASSFAHDGEDALFVDTLNREACLQAVRRLVMDDAFRQRLQNRALDGIVAHVPEGPALRLLEALFTIPPAPDR